MTDEMPATETSVRLAGYVWQVVGFFFIFLVIQFILSFFNFVLYFSFSIFSDVKFFHPLSLLLVLDIV